VSLGVEGTPSLGVWERKREREVLLFLLYLEFGEGRER